MELSGITVIEPSWALVEGDDDAQVLLRDPSVVIEGNIVDVVFGNAESHIATNRVVGQINRLGDITNRRGS